MSVKKCYKNWVTQEVSVNQKSILYTTAAAIGAATTKQITIIPPMARSVAKMGCCLDHLATVCWGMVISQPQGTMKRKFPWDACPCGSVRKNKCITLNHTIDCLRGMYLWQWKLANIKTAVSKRDIPMQILHCYSQYTNTVFWGL